MFLFAIMLLASSLLDNCEIRRWKEDRPPPQAVDGYHSGAELEAVAASLASDAASASAAIKLTAASLAYAYSQLRSAVGQWEEC